MANPSHIPVVFVRNAHVRKEHIAGEKAAQGKHDIMTIIHKGEERKIRHEVAIDLIVGESVVRVCPQNDEIIEKIREEVKEQSKREAKKAA